MLGCRAIRRARRDADGSVRLQCYARQHGRVMRQARERLERDGLHEEVEPGDPASHYQLYTC